MNKYHILNKQINLYQNNNSINIIISRYDLLKGKNRWNKQYINHYLDHSKQNIILSKFYITYFLLNIFLFCKTSSYVILNQNKIHMLNGIQYKFYFLHQHNSLFNIIKRNKSFIVKNKLVHIIYNDQNLLLRKINIINDIIYINYHFHLKYCHSYKLSTTNDLYLYLN